MLSRRIAEGHVFRYLFGFEGRIGRSAYWLFAPVPVALALLARAGEPASSLIPALREPLQWAVAALALAALWPSLALTVKRLHDRGKSAIWLLPFWALPLALFWFLWRAPGMIAFTLLPNPYVPPQLRSGLMIVGLVSAWATIELYGFTGSRGDNRYGADPLERETPPPESDDFLLGIGP